MSNAGKPWLSTEVDALLNRYGSGMSPAEMADLHGRTVSAIIARLCQLGLLVSRGDGYYRVDPDPWVTFAEIRSIEKSRRSMK